MAGRPRGEDHLVEYVVPMANRFETWGLMELGAQLIDTDACVRWLAERALIRNNLVCGTCRSPCRIHLQRDSPDGKRWYCGQCNIRTSIRDGSLFAKSKLSLKEIIAIIFCWANDLPQRFIQQESRVTNECTVGKWCSKLRRQCTRWIAQHPVEVGEASTKTTIL